MDLHEKRKARKANLAAAWNKAHKANAKAEVFVEAARKATAEANEMQARFDLAEEAYKKIFPESVEIGS